MPTSQAQITANKANAQKAGRPKAPHTLATEEARRFVVEQVAKNLQPLLQAKLDLAFGIYKEAAGKDGVMRVYQKAPDGTAIQYLLNQTVGKPKETLQVEPKINFIMDM